MPKLSDIAAAAGAPALSDRVVGVSAENADLLYTLQQIQTAIGISNSPFANSVVLDGVANNFATYNIFDHTQGPYWVNLNLFNVGALTGFTFSAINYPNTFPNYTTFNWSWPSPGSPLWGYPEIVYGTQGGGAFGGGPANKPTPKVLNSLGTLSLTYNLTLTTQSGDDTSYLIETWSQTVAGNQATVTAEILFYAYATPAVSSFILAFTTHFNYSVGGFNVYFAHDTADSRVYMMPVTAPSGTTALNMAQQGTTYIIDFAALITAALNAGWLTGTDLIAGYSVGFGDRENTGSAVFSRLEWTWK